MTNLTGLEIDEVWKQIDGFPNYQVSNMGRVRGKMGLLKLQSHAGYLRVGLKASKRHCVTVHKLVLTTFVGPRPGNCRKIHACHNDGNTFNNALSNLRWDTAGNNVKDKIKHDVVPKGEAHWKVKLTENDVMNILKEYRRGNSLALAKKYGVARATIQGIYEGRSWKHIFAKFQSEIKKAS